MKAMIVQGGYTPHQPKEVSEVFASILRGSGFEVAVHDSLDAFVSNDLTALDLIVPIWTMGKISNEQLKLVLAAVEGGVGIAGCHGGMCDAFRESSEWQFMTGGQFVAHPGNDGLKYSVKMVRGSNPLVDGIDDFEVSSEQYYMHVDPAVRVLATTHFPVADGPHVGNGEFDMPVVWTKMYGKGRVFYNSLGHKADIFDIPQAAELMRRGFVWAAGR